LDYDASRQLNKTQIRLLAQGEWLRLHQNILITGATGCGKTYIACALGHNHCQQGENVYYFRLKELLEKMFMAQADGSYHNKFHHFLSTANTHEQYMIEKPLVDYLTKGLSKLE
jgi:DNA replication protein DnaC